MDVSQFICVVFILMDVWVVSNISTENNMVVNNLAPMKYMDKLYIKDFIYLHFWYCQVPALCDIRMWLFLQNITKWVYVTVDVQKTVVRNNNLTKLKFAFLLYMKLRPYLFVLGSTIFLLLWHISSCLFLNYILNRWSIF